MPFSSVPVRVQPYFGYRSPSRLKLEARALRSAPGAFESRGRIRAFRTMLAHFASREEPGLKVRLEIAGPGGTLLAADATSDAEGFVHFDLPLEPHWDLPEHPAWETAELFWVNGEGQQMVEAHVLTPGLDSRLAVISDIDDTIIETGITGGWRALLRNWRRVLAELPDERIAVSGADVFYGTLGGGPVLPPGERRPTKRIPATHRPFFYVSSSPWNLFSYLVAFQRAKHLPLGPLLLRDWGFNRETLGSAGHGEHKSAAINAILQMYPDLRFALIGDDTQGDLPAFAQAVEAFPGRIAAVFMRIAAGEALTPAESAARQAIEKAGVPLWLGDSYAIGEQFLHTLGFTPGGETEQIVKVVDKVGEEVADSTAGAS